MISFLRGKIISKSLNYIILDVHDIGYQVFVGENFLNELKINAEIEIYLHHRIKEDASDLYGFKTLADLEMFELLLTVSGVGPKSALGALSIASADDVKESVIRGDAGLLNKVAGIGKKTAERIVLELKNKVVRNGGETATVNSLNFGSDEIDALMSLGYSLSEARNVLNAVDPKITDSGERLKEALKKAGK